MPAQHELHETFDAILVLGCGSQYFCLITDESESLMSTVKCCLAVRGSMCSCARLVWLSMAAGGDKQAVGCNVAISSGGARWECIVCILDCRAFHDCSWPARPRQMRNMNLNHERKISKTGTGASKYK